MQKNFPKWVSKCGFQSRNWQSSYWTTQQEWMLLLAHVNLCINFNVLQCMKGMDNGTQHCLYVDVTHTSSISTEANTDPNISPLRESEICFELTVTSHVDQTQFPCWNNCWSKYILCISLAAQAACSSISRHIHYCTPGAALESDTFSHSLESILLAFHIPGAGQLRTFNILIVSRYPYNPNNDKDL